jgi:hypothetical protein
VAMPHVKLSTIENHCSKMTRDLRSRFRGIALPPQLEGLPLDSARTPVNQDIVIQVPHRRPGSWHAGGAGLRESLDERLPFLSHQQEVIPRPV